MILRRVTHHIKAQNWSAVAVEFVLVVLGVFLGVAAANWNEERLQKLETQQLLLQVDEELETFVAYIDRVETYYASAGGYADQATAAWNGDIHLNDNDFVIAAYQASQITGINANSSVWSAIFGAEHLRDIEDPAIRNSLAAVMTFDYSLTDLASVSSRYREEVRKLIPDDLQAQIRKHCGDRWVGRAELGWVLPPTCELQLHPGKAAGTADALRARKELVNELNWHRAAIANQLAQAQNLKRSAAELTKLVGA